MKPRHDIPRPSRRRLGIDRGSMRMSFGRNRSDPVVDMALRQMRILMAQGWLGVEDIEKFQALLKANRQAKVPGSARMGLLRFVMELMGRHGGASPGASPMPAPVFPRGGNPPLAGGAEAPLN